MQFLRSIVDSAPEAWEKDPAHGFWRGLMIPGTEPALALPKDPRENYEDPNSIEERKLYSTNRLKEAAVARGHSVRVVVYNRCYMNITSRRSEVLPAGKPLHFDAVIPRIGASNTSYGTAVVRQFEMQRTYPVNTSQGISRSRDKLRALQPLAREGIGMPVTGFARSTHDVQGLLELVGGAPLIVKLLEGTQGIGVVLAETVKAAESVVAAFIFDALGRDRSPVKAKHHWIVIGHVTSPLVHRGDAIAHIAELPQTVGSEGK